MNTAASREQLLAHAQFLIRQRGCNGFSYHNLAIRAGVKTSNVDYHFPCKDELLVECVDNCTAEDAGRMHGIDATLPACERLSRYVALFCDAPPEQACLCGLFAGDFAALSDRVRQAVRSFYQAHERWLAKVVADGLHDGTLEWPGDPEPAGRYLFSALQGAMISARLFQAPGRIHDVVASIRARRGPD